MYTMEYYSTLKRKEGGSDTRFKKIIIITETM